MSGRRQEKTEDRLVLMPSGCLCPVTGWGEVFCVTAAAVRSAVSLGVDGRTTAAACLSFRRPAHHVSGVHARRRPVCFCGINSPRLHCIQSKSVESCFRVRGFVLPIVFRLSSNKERPKRYLVLFWLVLPGHQISLFPAGEP